MGHLHEIAAVAMVGEPEDELVTVVCACGWESGRVWSDDGAPEAFRQHLRAVAADGRAQTSGRSTPRNVAR